MLSILSDIAAGYGKLFTEYANPVTREYSLLLASPYIVPITLIVYLLFCLKVGPWYMKDREPYDFSNIIKLHNLSQVLMSSYMVYLGTWRVFFTDFDLKCQHTTIDDKYFEIEAAGCYLYFIAKLTELLDTVFFILRKSFRQVTFLHVFHHTIMPLGCWLGMLLNPGGNGIIMGYMNSAVHVVMYSYYLIANFGPKYKKYLWWKKYVTIFQLVQFVIVGAHAFRSLYYNYCGYPYLIKLFVVAQSVVFFIMFGDFYLKTYWKNEKKTNSVTTDKHTHGKIKSQ